MAFVGSLRCSLLPFGAAHLLFLINVSHRKTDCLPVKTYVIQIRMNDKLILDNKIRQ